MKKQKDTALNLIKGGLMLVIGSFFIFATLMLILCLLFFGGCLIVLLG